MEHVHLWAPSSSSNLVIRLMPLRSWLTVVSMCCFLFLTAVFGNPALERDGSVKRDVDVLSYEPS